MNEVKRRPTIVEEYLERVPGLDEKSYRVLKLRKLYCRLELPTDFCLLLVLTALCNAFTYGGLSWDRLLVTRSKSGPWEVEIWIQEDPKANKMAFKIFSEQIDELTK